MQLPRLAVLLAVYSGVQATLSPDEPTGKPDMKLETNQTGASRFLNMPGLQQFVSPSYGPPMNTGMGNSGFMSQQPQYTPSQAQSQAQVQTQSFRVPPIQSSPYRTSSGQYSPYSGTGGGAIEQMAPISDDQTFTAATPKFSFPGGSANAGFSSGSLGGLGGMGLPQTLTVFGNIPVTVSGTLNFGVRGQLTVAQDGAAGSVSGGVYENNGLGSGYQPYQGSSPGTISGFPGLQQSGMAYNRQQYQPPMFGRSVNSLSSYQPAPPMPNVSPIGGSIGSSGSTYAKTQTAESGLMQVQGQTQLVYGPGGSQSQMQQTNLVPTFPGGIGSGYPPTMGPQSGFQMTKTGSMNPMGSPQGMQQMSPVSYQMQRSGGQTPGQSPYGNTPRFSEVVARGMALNDEPADKPEQ